MISESLNNKNIIRRLKEKDVKIIDFIILEDFDKCPNKLDFDISDMAKEFGISPLFDKSYDYARKNYYYKGVKILGCTAGDSKRNNLKVAVIGNNTYLAQDPGSPHPWLWGKYIGTLKYTSDENRYRNEENRLNYVHIWEEKNHKVIKMKKHIPKILYGLSAVACFTSAGLAFVDRQPAGVWGLAFGGMSAYNALPEKAKIRLSKSYQRFVGNISEMFPEEYQGKVYNALAYSGTKAGSNIQALFGTAQGILTLSQALQGYKGAAIGSGVLDAGIWLSYTATKIENKGAYSALEKSVNE